MFSVSLFKTSGTAANPVAFQAYPLEDVTRWNAERAVTAVKDKNSTQLYSFDMTIPPKNQVKSLPGLITPSG